MKRNMFRLLVISGICIFLYILRHWTFPALLSLFKLLYSHLFPFLSAEDSKVILENTDSLMKIILELAAIFVALTGIRHLIDLRQKQNFATVSYLSPLRARLHYLKQSLTDYKVYIFSALEQNGRRTVDASRVEFVKQLKTNIAMNCEETRKFLEGADEPYPAGRGWTNYLESLILLLLNLERITQEDFFVWDSSVPQESKENEYQTWIKNLENMILMIDKRQRELENRLFPTLPFRDVILHYLHNRENH